ncbi:MAG: ABC transporter substrate-binding protein [Pseudobdellovibrionaceae bacterium]
MKKRYLLYLFLVVFFAGTYLFLKKDKPTDFKINIGLSGRWNTLHPGLQHTYYADLVLSNQFEALVGENDQGVSVPLGAKSWIVNDDFTQFTFNIDTEKTFSDGSKLTASDYKRSWEEALKLEPISANSSLLDVLYKIKGFEGFKKTGHISGLKVVNEATLVIDFSTPFRMALEHLKGNRFAAYKVKDNKFYGTGKFEIQELENNHCLMIPRKDLGVNSPILDVKFISGDKIISSLISGEIDVIHDISGENPEIDKIDDAKFNYILGPSSVHKVISLNSNSEFFKKINNRKAFLYQLYQTLKNNPSLIEKTRFIKLDFQFYLPLQAGRLEEREVEEIIFQGKPFVDGFLKEKFIFRVGPNSSYNVDIISYLGKNISEKSGLEDQDSYFKYLYGQTGPDSFLHGFSIASGDPDGLYHKLGKNGAIRTPYVYSDVVGDLLEEGRKITDINKLDEHYKKVSRALLTEVPMIHLGFSKTLTFYRTDKVEIDTTVLRRNQGQLHFLRMK